MPIIFESTPCNICGSDHFEPFLDRGDLNTDIPGIFHLVKCTQCGLVYQNPRPAPQSWDDIYPEEYDQYTLAPQGAGASKYSLSRYGIYKRARLLAKFSPGGKVCDIGCSTGDFLTELSNQPQWDCYGVEPKATAVEIAKKRGLNVYQGEFSPDVFPGVQFDVFTLWNVIEHLHDPVGTLTTIRERLNPGGVLIFNTPNLNSWDAALFKENWIGYELPRHLYVFSEKTIRDLLIATDFIWTASLCFYGQHAAAMSSVRFLLRSLFHKKTRFVEDILFSTLSRIVFAPVFYLQDSLRKSSQITIVAGKSKDL